MDQAFSDLKYKYVDNAITTLSGNIVSDAPSQLDTLNKIALSINSDPNYKTHTHDDLYYGKDYIDTALSGTGSGTTKYMLFDFNFNKDYDLDTLFTTGYSSNFVPQTGIISDVILSGYVSGKINIELIKNNSVENVPDVGTVIMTPSSGIEFTGKAFGGDKVMNITPSRHASNNSIDSDLATFDNIFFNDFEYRFGDSPKRLMSTKITISTHNGWISTLDGNLDVYYIPVGKTIPSEYVKLGTIHCYSGDPDWSHHVSEIIVSNNGWVYADGIYLVHTDGAFEEGWAHLEEVECYTFDNPPYTADRIGSFSNWSDTTLSAGDILSARLVSNQKSIIYVNVSVIMEVNS